jgi:hypothetical protein
MAIPLETLFMWNYDTSTINSGDMKRNATKNTTKL